MSIKQGDRYIAGGGGAGSVETDNISISTNASNKIQSIGNINKNPATGALPVKYDWIGTLAQFNQQDIANTHPEWVCYVTDDVAGGESVYTKEEVDEGFLATNKITNCITEIPQDIKLELNNGTLTLKAGSKVYVPNGSNTYNIVTISSDLTISSSTTTRIKGVVFYRSDTNELYFDTTDGMSSGSSASPSKTTWMWYDTTNNIIKRTENTGSSWFGEFSFPICIFTRDSGAIQSIDQVFNGFGYMGSTVFALPGVKGLIPNGRNVDGSLKNIEFSLSQVQTLTITSAWGTGNEGWWLNGINLNIHRAIGATYFQDSKPSTSHHDAYWFSPKENILRQTTDIGATWTQIQGSYSFNISFTSGKVTSLTPKTAFHAVDYNDAVLTSNLATCHVVTQTYKNGSSWYRVYDDGWCEQGGFGAEGWTYFLKPFTSTDYTIITSAQGPNADATYGTNIRADRRFADRFYPYYSGSTITGAWLACGYISQGA